jgi:hypothetical protein
MRPVSECYHNSAQPRISTFIQPMARKTANLHDCLQNSYIPNQESSKLWSAMDKFDIAGVNGGNDQLPTP